MLGGSRKWLLAGAEVGGAPHGAGLVGVVDVGEVVEHVGEVVAVGEVVKVA